ncbi:TetR family transcriptional regulator [Arsenophonus nasoniae]|uniref:TetR family transcriptional regulator n=1 Tax=Arsenophonus nasoniae TaxID=638 RepID=A0AA95GGQ5_9GAMM|nr:TetR family transcriptional regulator [Arsenophonus nasoniae]WGL96684.1 TetR family transcriptional regulator [Arsenophonus nasoniae]
MRKVNQQYSYRLTGEEVKHPHTSNKKKKLSLIDRLILLFGMLFVFYCITVVMK